MADVFVRVEVHPDCPANRLAHAVKEMHDRDPDFLWPDRPWWHKPPDRARAWIARTLSKYGLNGRLSVVEHPGGNTPWDQEPPPRWTGFSPRMEKA